MHVGALLPPRVNQQMPQRLFAPVDRPCASFSAWWKHSTKGIQRLSDLPGLSGLSTHGRGGRCRSEVPSD
jgi:deoxyribodipyrimidine photo-lyase